MEADKYSPKWLLNKLNKSKTDAHKLMHIIDYQKEVALTCEICSSKDIERNEKILYWAKQLENKPLSIHELVENAKWLLDNVATNNDKISNDRTRYSS